MWRQGLDSGILMVPFLLGILYDSLVNINCKYDLRKRLYGGFTTFLPKLLPNDSSLLH